MKLILSLFLSSIVIPSLAQDSIGKPWSLHFQSTIIPQYHFDFKAPYSGDNSLQPSEPARASASFTLFAAWKPFKHTYVVFNPEAAGGKGLSKTLGIAGFPNGEVYRVGDPAPKPFIARLYVEQRFPLSTRMTTYEDDENQVAEKSNADYFSIAIGKFSLTDFFDNSLISHDPRTQFMNWSLMANGAWDYPANTRGYTMGAVAQAIWHDWALRTALTTVPIEANGPELQFKWNKAMGFVTEIEKNNLFKESDDKFSSVHAGVFYNQASMGNYKQALSMGGALQPDVTVSRAYGRRKWGLYAGLDNHLGSFHQFLKASWNDGKNETWAFTEIDRSFAFGFQFDHPFFQRNNDRLGFAMVSNGLSPDHRAYLEQGGYGFLIGDGKLNYAMERILEVYYSIALSRHFSLSPDYQFVNHPGYNRDRGPVHIVALRLHATF